MSLRVGIDASPLHGRSTGIGRYVRELCLELRRALPDTQFFLYSPRTVDLPPDAGWQVREDTRARRLPAYVWLKWRAGRLCARDGLDVFWATRTLAPRLPAGVAVVSTVYDLNHKIVPDTMPLVNRWAHRLWFDADVARARSVVAISQGTSDRLRATLGRAADAVVVPAVSDRYRSQPREAVNACLARFGIDKPYLLGVGTLEPRKNLDVLVEAYAVLRARGLVTQDLVLAGSPGWQNRPLREALARHHALPIHCIGYVADDELPRLYSGADLFVFPSRYEGFGIPVLEARACGARIVATDLPELREAGAGAAHYVPPTVEGLVAGIPHALGRSWPAEGRDRLSSWTRSAAALARVLQAAS